VLSCYQPLLQKAIQYRYIVVSLCLALFLISVSLILAQQVPLRLLSDIQTEIATASVTLSNKTTLENDKTIEAVNRIEQAALDINKETEKQFGESAISLTRSFVASHSNHGEVYATLTHNTPLSNQEVMQLWKDKTGHIAQASQLSFQSSVNIDNAGFHLQLHSTNKEALTLASSAFIQHLEKIPGVLSVKNITSNQQTSIIATPNATANTLGISNQNIASQLHLALNGISSSSNTESAIKLQLEKNSFSHLADLSNLPIQISPTQTLALSSIATLKTISEDSRITRENGQHIAHIQADIDPNIIKPRQLLALAERDFLISMNQEFANVGWSTTGSLSAETEIKTYLIQSFIISLLVMFVFLAIFLNSYSQPILIFTAIPYGIVGALLGHFIFDQALTLWSFAGMIAVSGIVVNNNMVIIFFINEQLKAGHSILETVMQAGANRFRPIMLTTITTFTGVLPTILGNSWETQFLIPLAISIGCGVVFAALLTLLLVPCLYMIGDDFRNTNGPARPAQA